MSGIRKIVRHVIRSYPHGPHNKPMNMIRLYDRIAFDTNDLLRFMIGCATSLNIDATPDRNRAMSHSVSRAILLSVSLLAAVPALAQDAPLLTVDSHGESRSYDLDSLKALGESEFESTTIWTEGAHRFTGVPLAAILADSGIATGPGVEGEVTATAINDYAISIPLREIDDAIPLVAYYMDGEEMSVRDKGPLWIVFPYDSDKRYQTEVVYSQSIWQLDRISATDTE